jgi:hypothetical protein
VAVAEDVVAGELVDVVELDLALLAGGSRGVVLVEDGAVVAQRVAVGQRGDLLVVLAHAPRLHVLVLVDQRTQPHRHLDLLVRLLHNDYNLYQTSTPN